MKTTVLAAMLIAWAVGAPALEVALVADRISVDASAAPLQDILRDLAAAGIRVQADPRINPPVTARFRDRDVEKGLQRLLADLDYVLLWEVVRGPAGPIPRLAEVRVFRKGEEHLMRPVPAPDQPPKPAPGTAGTVTYVRGDVLVMLRPGADAAAVKRVLAAAGGTIVDSIPELGIYRIRITSGADAYDVARALAGHPDVRHAEPNLAYSTPSPVPLPDGAPPAALARSTVPAKGAPAVAVLDTGYDPGVGLSNLVVASLDALNPARPITDSQGHGTQMALLAGGAVQPAGLTGTASSASTPVIAIRAFDDKGYASSYSLMQSMVFALNNGARVISMSWSSSQHSGFMESSMAYAASNGAVLVAAAGNTPSGLATYPAAYPGVIGVGASLPDGSVWSNSNYGASVALSAPGVASLPVGYQGPPGAYAGTSISAAFVANTVARYLAAHPSASAQQAALALTSALSTPSGSGGTARYGAGLLDAAAVARLMGK